MADKLDPITDEALKVLWQDDKEPEITGMTRTYHVGMPVDGKSNASSPVWAEIKVYDHDYCELDRWLFFGHRPKRDGTGYFLVVQRMLSFGKP